jgi:hypothetical protein
MYYNILSTMSCVMLQAIKADDLLQIAWFIVSSEVPVKIGLLPALCRDVKLVEPCELRNTCFCETLDAHVRTVRIVYKEVLAHCCSD